MKKKITIVDILIVLAVVLVAVFVFGKFSGTAGASKKTVTYTVLVTSVMPEVADSMVPDDNVLLDAKGNAYGRDTNVSVSPSQDSYLNQQTEKYSGRQITPEGAPQFHLFVGFEITCIDEFCTAFFDKRDLLVRAAHQFIDGSRFQMPCYDENCGISGKDVRHKGYNNHHPRCIEGEK